MTFPSSLALLPTLARRRRAEGGMVWPRTHRAHALCYSMSPLPGLIQTVRTQFKPFKPKLKPKLKPSSNPIQTVRTQFKPFKPKLKPSSNPIQTVRTHLEPQLKIHISSHAARDSEGGSNSRSYRHDELNNQLPSVLFRFSTHKKNKFFVKH